MTTPVLRLDGRTVGLVLALGEAGPLVLHWGERWPDGIDLSTLPEVAALPGTHASLDGQHQDAVLLPTLGAGGFGHPALAGGRGSLDWTAGFAGWRAERDGDDGLLLAAADPVARLEVALELRLAPDDVLRCRTRLRNAGEAPYTVDWLAACCLTVGAEAGELLSFAGRWGGEWREERQPLAQAGWLKENRRGRTSHDAFPGLVLGEPGFGEDAGRVWGFHLGWSGNHRLLVEAIDDGRRRVQLGELLMPGELILAPGEEAATPWAFASFAADGLDGLARRFHAHVRRRVLRWPGGRMRPRPVTLCTWEANYFAHDEAKLRRQAEAAAALGVERFLLDDGWFKGRGGERAALGDWTPDPVKYPQGLGGLARHVAGLGMEFGLWVEPEMVSPDSDLYRVHRDWALHVAGRPLVTGRHQLVLDLTRPEVGDHLFAVLDELLRRLPIAFLKWDMNRDLTAAGNAAGRPAYRGQTLAVWALIDRLREAHPGVEIESCASGGGRADYGILARTHRVWTSDGTDALERQRIQRGFQRFLPPEIMGAHVAAAPNHQTGRRHTLAFRAVTALFGHMGLELDPLALTPGEAEELRAWIALHKRLRPLLHGGGEVVRMAEAQGRLAHGVIAPDRGHAVFAAVQLEQPPARRTAPLVLRGLDPARSYRLTLPAPQHARQLFRPTPAQTALVGEGIVLPAAALAGAGLRLPEMRPESAFLIEAVMVGEG